MAVPTTPEMQQRFVEQFRRNCAVGAYEKALDDETPPKFEAVDHWRGDPKYYPPLEPMELPIYCDMSSQHDLTAVQLVTFVRPMTWRERVKCWFLRLIGR